jgi:hypothetical protein
MSVHASPNYKGALPLVEKLRAEADWEEADLKGGKLELERD